MVVYVVYLYSFTIMDYCLLCSLDSYHNITVCYKLKHAVTIFVNTYLYLDF